MQTSIPVTKDIFWVGGNDSRLELFENIFPLPKGVTYNAYVLLDDKTCALDTVDACYVEGYVETVNATLGGRGLDYLVITHMEPDHAAGIVRLCEEYPDMTLVGNNKMLQMLGQFFPVDLAARFKEVNEGDTLPLGKHTLQFINAPMVHWPEVMFAYEQSEKILFSADAFGTFGALSGNLFADEVDFEHEFLDEARRYYANIVGKYGPQVQAVLKKAATLDIAMIAPLHGPVWRENIEWFINKYDLWSRYEPEEKGVVVACGSMYGHTRNAAEVLVAELAAAGVKNIRLYDISKTHTSELVSEIFKYSHAVLCAPTYNMGIYLPMETLIHDMEALNVQNRKIAILGNGSWAPQGPALMKKRVEAMKDTELLAEPFVVRSSLKQEQMPALTQLAATIAASVNA